MIGDPKARPRGCPMGRVRGSVGRRCLVVRNGAEALASSVPGPTPAGPGCPPPCCPSACASRCGVCPAPCPACGVQGDAARVQRVVARAVGSKSPPSGRSGVSGEATGWDPRPALRRDRAPGGRAREEPGLPAGPLWGRPRGEGINVGALPCPPLHPVPHLKPASSCSPDGDSEGRPRPTARQPPELSLRRHRLRAPRRTLPTRPDIPVRAAQVQPGLTPGCDQDPHPAPRSRSDQDPHPAPARSRPCCADSNTGPRGLRVP